MKKESLGIQHNGLNNKAKIKKGINNILNTNKNMPPNRLNTSANTDKMTVKMTTKGVKSTSINMKKTLRLIISNNKAINISMVFLVVNLFINISYFNAMRKCNKSYNDTQLVLFKNNIYFSTELMRYFG